MYTVDSSFRTVAVGAPARWVAAIEAHNAGEAGEIVAAYFAAGARFGLNADLALAQSCVECAWFTSRRWVEQRNPCGLGVTGADAPGPAFASIADGATAHYQHLCCYCYPAPDTRGAGGCPVEEQGMALLDPRHTFHDGLPRVADLVRPERKWANPGNGYAAAIVSIANNILGKGDGRMQAPTSAAIGFPVHIHEAADVGPGRAVGDVRWFIVHDTEGNFAGDEAVLTGAAPPVESAHALIGRDGTLVAMVQLDVTAWTPGNDAVARLSVNVELSGFATDGYTDAQYAALAAYFRWCVGQGMTGVPAIYIGRRDADGGPLPDAPGILGHQDVPDPDQSGAWGGVARHTDPGPRFDWARLIALIGGETPAVPNTFYADGNPLGAVPVAPPFWNRWHALNAAGLALPMMGWPAEPERTVSAGRRVQRFERGWYATQPAPDPWDVVQLPPAEVAALGL